MTISNISALSATPSTTQVGAQANDTQMNQFLQLLTAQLKNQDPMQPTDPTQFVAQLAQFSTVEQLVQGNTKLDALNKTTAGASLSQYSAMINHTVSATASTMTVPASGDPSPLTFNVTTSGLTNVHIDISDSSGNVVRSLGVSGSSGTLNFDGNDGNGQRLAAGDYQVKLNGTSAAGASVSAGTLGASGKVQQAVQGSDGTWRLQLDNGQAVDASGVMSIS